MAYNYPINTTRDLEMFGLNEAMFNAVKRQAKKLNDKYESLSNLDRKNDKLVAGVITEIWEPVSTVISRDRFVWVAGYLRGRVGHDENGNSLYE